MKVFERHCVYSEGSDNVLVIYKTIENARIGRKLASQMYPQEKIKMGVCVIKVM